MAILIYGFTSIDTADGNSLKEIDGAVLDDGYMAYGLHGGSLLSFELDADSGAAESIPTVVAPTSNAGNKRWLLKNSYAFKQFFKDATELTIDTGAITATQSVHMVDTASDDATDDLDTINGGAAGMLLAIRASHADRTIVVKHNTGNIYTGGTDITLDDVTKYILLLYDGTLSKWMVINGANVSGTNTGDETAARIATIITGTAAETTPLDADEFPFYKIVGTALKKVTWSNIKATLLAYFDTLFSRKGDLKQNLLPNSRLSVWSNGTVCDAISGAAPVTDGANAALANNLLTNGGFDSDAASWTAISTTLASVAGGKTGNCIELTKTIEAVSIAYQNLTLSAGKLYQLSGYVKSGTSGNEAFDIAISDGHATSGNVIAAYSGTSSGSWVQYSLIFEATTQLASTGSVWLRKNSVTAGTMLFDSITLVEVTPGCIAADALAFDGWEKTSTLDIYREYNSAYIKGLYGVKVVKGADTAERLYQKYGSQSWWYKPLQGRNVTLGCWAYSVTSSTNVKLTIYNHSGWTDSSTFVPADTLTWIELPVTCNASGTEFTFGFLFDGSTGDVAYISEPILALGSSIGEGNWMPKLGEKMVLETGIASNYLSALSTSDVSSTLNIEADTSGKLPKGVKSINVTGRINDSGSAAATSTNQVLGVYSGSLSGGKLYFDCNGVANDSLKYFNGEVGLDAMGNMPYVLDASGSGTLDITVWYKSVQF